MRTFTQADGPELRATGTAMLKRPNPVYMKQHDEPFAVETTEGTLSAAAGDYVAHDPISGHVWPVKASYVDQHYQIHELLEETRG